MPKTPSYKLSISNNDEIGFTLHSVVLEPRRCTPLDLAAAVKNLRIDFHGENEDEIAIISKKIVNYLLTDFFVLAHRTGFYNRQLKLWEALASVCEVKMAQLQQGFFKKIELPIWDFPMLDSKGRTRLLVRLVFDAPNSEFDLSNEKGCKALIASTVQRAERLKVENPLFSGVFLFCPNPAAEYVRSCLSMVTVVDDPVGKYEAKIVSLPDVSLDLFEYDHAGDELKMLHPRLQKMNSSERSVAI
jgi:hypothetical protein